MLYYTTSGKFGHVVKRSSRVRDAASISFGFNLCTAVAVHYSYLRSAAAAAVTFFAPGLPFWRLGPFKPFLPAIRLLWLSLIAWQLPGTLRRRRERHACCCCFECRAHLLLPMHDSSYLLLHFLLNCAFYGRERERRKKAFEDLIFQFAWQPDRLAVAVH